MAIELGVHLPILRFFRLSTDVADVARGFEEQGFDSAWSFDRLLVPADQSGEHGLYGVPDLPWDDFYRHVADPIVTLSMAAAVTKRIKLGTSVLIAPLHHPVRLARSLATLDAATEGRFLMGLGTIAEAVWGPDPVSYPGSRQFFKGSLEQLVDDIGKLAEVGVQHVFLALPLAVREKGALPVSLKENGATP